MFRETKVEKRENNSLINMQINLSLCRTSGHYFLPPSPRRLSQNLKMYHLHMCKIDVVEIIMYIILKYYKLALSGGFIKNYSKAVTACIQHLHCNGESGNPQQTISLFCKILLNKFLKRCFNAFKRHWINTETICLNKNLQTWNMFLHTGLTELYMFFIFKSITFLA